jgi:uncharacterized repeat protein (TIGR01451 family)
MLSITRLVMMACCFWVSFAVSASQSLNLAPIIGLLLSGGSLDEGISGAQTRSIAENSANGTNVGAVLVTTGSPTGFSITSGNTNDAFAISSAGQITVADSGELDFETKSSYTLAVEITKADMTSQSATITINVTNVNEGSVSISDETRSIAENSANATTVGAVLVTTGSPTGFSITSGNTNSAFAISSAGQITVADSGELDFETTPSYSLTVEITKADTSSQSATITINVTNVNEGSVSISDETRSIAENSANATTVGAVLVTTGSPTGFSITSGNTNSAFAISSAGQITVADSGELDFETTPSYPLTVEITKADTTSQSATITINVTNVNEGPTLVLTKGVLASDNPTSDATVSPNPSIVPVDGNIFSADAGDTVQYQLTIENTGDTGGAPAYDVIITDPALSELTALTIISVTDGNGAPLATSGNLNTGLTLTDPLAGNDGTPGAPYSSDTAIVTYSYTLDMQVTPRQVIQNTASVIWASASAAVSFPAVSDSANVTIADPTIINTIDSITPESAGPGLITSGDTVTYRFNVTLPEGTTPDLTLTNALPPGLKYIDATVGTTGFNGSIDITPSITPSGDPTSGGETVTIVFDSPVNSVVANDNNVGNNSFSVTLRTLVLGDTAVNDGLPVVQTKSNNVTLTYTGQTGSAIQDSVSIDYAEPDLVITKAFSPDTGLVAGDTVTITLMVANNGTSPAYDITLTDILNSGGELLFDLATIVDVSTPPRFAYSYANPTVSWEMTSGSLAAGAQHTFQFQGEVRDSVVTGASFANSATVSGNSQAGVVAEERTTTDTGSDTAITASQQDKGT